MKKLYVVGIGPGNEEFLTYEAKKVLENSDFICGYTVYIELVRNYLPEKEMLSTPMKQEISRCKLAFETAMTGKVVSLVCSGDAGVYALASPVLELQEKFPEVEVEIIPGITASISGGAILGAPLSHDFATISLSDLLTPLEIIKTRLELTAKADFCIVIYNPSSTKRADYLKMACEILLNYKKTDTICGIVKNIGRCGQEYQILTLDELKNTQVDMFSTVFIGNSQTKVVNNRMVTPRGYEIL